MIGKAMRLRNRNLQPLRCCKYALNADLQIPCQCFEFQWASIVAGFIQLSTFIFHSFMKVCMSSFENVKVDATSERLLPITRGSLAFASLSMCNVRCYRIVSNSTSIL